MSGLQSKRWYFFVWDADHSQHLWDHKICESEAEEVFFNPYVITPNKKKHGPKRFRIDGLTNNGRSIRLIFQDLGRNVDRIITEWDL